MTLAVRTTAPLLAALSGLALFAAHPPLGWWWTSFLHAPLLVAAVHHDRAHRSSVRGARLGALAGFTCFAPLISWLIAPAGYVGWGLLVGTQVAAFALVGWLVGLIHRPLVVPIAAAAIWTGAEAWRGIAPLNGFEWGGIAYAHAGGTWLLPIARVLGGRGITFLTVLIGVSALVVVHSLWQTVRQHGTAGVEAGFASTRGPIGVLVASLLASALLVTDAPAPAGSLDVLVAQGHDVRFWEDPVPNLPLYVATALRDETLDAVGDGPVPDLVVWPESSIDRDPESAAGDSLAPIIEEVAREVGELVAGTTLDGPSPRVNRYVAASHYADGFNEIDRYTKRRLVPFGEYVPMRRFLEWFPPLEQVPRDALPGRGPEILTMLDGTRLAVVICFETLFTDIVRSNVLAEADPAQVLITVTNDASFRDTAEPAQHLAQSQIRAVETGRWVVHAALSGSSAFVDPSGNLHDQTPLFTRTTIRRQVPLVDDLTPYMVIGDVVGSLTRLVVFVLAVAALGARLRVLTRSRSTALTR